MDQGIISQIDRAKELLKELENSCSIDLTSQNISERTKNLTQEIILKMRHVLDQSLYRFFEKRYMSKLSEEEIEKAKVYFPIVSKKEDIKSMLGRAEMKSLQQDFPDFYNFLNSIQPYNSDYKWLKHLADFANQKHIRLTPQVKKKRKTMTAKIDDVSITTPIDNKNFSIKQGKNCNVFIGGVPARFTNRGIVPLGPGLKTEITEWVSFVFENTDVNTLWLCKKAVEGVERIVNKIFSFI